MRRSVASSICSFLQSTGPLSAESMLASTQHQGWHQLSCTRGMAFKKAGGTARQKNDTPARNLGVRYLQNEVVFPGQIILTQRGTKYHAGENVGIGKNHTIFAKMVGQVHFSHVMKEARNHKETRRTVVNVKPLDIDGVSYDQFQDEALERRAMIKRQILKHKAHEAALHFAVSSHTYDTRTIPLKLTSSDK